MLPSEENKFKYEKSSTFELPISVLCRWLKMLKDKTHNNDIEHALRKAHFVELTDEEREIVSTIRQIYIAEMNGDLNPPPSMREIYENIEDYFQ